MLTQKMRIDKFLSAQLNISRTDAKKLLKSGVVAINGTLASKGDIQLDALSDSVAVNGKKIEYRQHIYIMLNKPQGVVSASESNEDITVVDLVPDELSRTGLFPAGRLDKDTTGFVLITDDGEFAHNILSPSKHIKKTYIVGLERDVLPEEYGLFRQGIQLSDILLKPALLQKVSDCVYEITITEGRYHQIKRMFASLGNKVTSLKRIKMGELELDPDLPEGKCREITADELSLITK